MNLQRLALTFAAIAAIVLFFVSPAFAEAAATADPAAKAPAVPWWAIAAIVVAAVSEIVGLVDKWKSNSVLTLILNLAKGAVQMFGKAKK